MRALLSGVVLALALAGCGRGQDTSHRPASPVPTASAPVPSQPPTVIPPLIAVADRTGDGETTLSLVSLDGHQVAHTIVPASASWQGVGGGLLTFVDHGTLKGLKPSGAVETLGSLAGSADGAVVSPDGQHWMTATLTSDASGVTSQLVLGTRGGADRVVARLTAQDRHLTPFRWTAGGPIYQHAVMGVGGYILFGDGASGPTYRLDAGSGQVSTVLGTSDASDCRLADLAADGTIACVRSMPSLSLAVLSPGGHVVEMPLPRPAFNQYGAVSFLPGSGQRLVIGGATSAGPNQEQYVTYLFDAGSRQLRPFGPAGLRPVAGPSSWLPDGSLLTYRPEGAAGGSPGIYVVRPDGSARKVLASGTPLGVITG